MEPTELTDLDSLKLMRDNLMVNLKITNTLIQKKESQLEKNMEQMDLN